MGERLVDAARDETSQRIGIGCRAAVGRRFEPVGQLVLRPLYLMALGIVEQRAHR